MNENRPHAARRLLQQQQPQRPDNRQQQQHSGSGEFQPQRARHAHSPGQMVAQADDGQRRGGQHSAY